VISNCAHVTLLSMTKFDSEHSKWAVLSVGLRGFSDYWSILHPRKLWNLIQWVVGEHFLLPEKTVLLFSAEAIELMVSRNGPVSQCSIWYTAVLY